MTAGPLSRLRQSLVTGDRHRAARLLRHTRWTNLCNALRALPARVRPSAYRLLNQQQLNEVDRQLTEPERREMHAAGDLAKPDPQAESPTKDNPAHSQPASRSDTRHDRD
jgi:hypothetical protein